MIHKKYKTDGTPDFRNFAVECNRCHTRRDLSGSESWLIPICEQMSDYCPFCEYKLAYELIRSATTIRARFTKFMARRGARKG